MRGAQRVVRVVGREQNAEARLGQRFDFAQHLSLIAEIERSGRLVKHDEARLLREGSRKQHELPLAAGNLGVGTLRQMRDAKAIQHRLRDCEVIRRGPREQRAVGGASHQHDGLHGEGEGAGMHLWDIADHPRALARRYRGKPPTVQGDFAVARRQ